MLQIFSDNYRHHEAQRRERERILVFPHQLPNNTTPALANLLTTFQDSQYQCYRSRGGRENQGINNTNDYRHNSSIHWNMRPGNH
jgi:hypothetical protein